MFVPFISASVLNERVTSKTFAGPCDFHGAFSAADPPGEHRNDSITVRPDCALPYHGDAPSRGIQCSDRFDIPSLVAGQFVFPESGPSAGQAKVLAAIVVVPEAAVNEYAGVPSGQDQIRSAGQFPDVQSIAKTRLPQTLAHAHFRQRVLVSDA